MSTQNMGKENHIKPANMTTIAEKKNVCSVVVVVDSVISTNLYQ